MRLKLTCKNCRRNIEIQGNSIPKKIECPNCSEMLGIPANILDVDAVIGGYKVIKHLGSGGMGCVYLAQQLMVDREVALKVLPPEMTKDQAKIQIFLKEIRLLAKLHHPNIVTAFEAGKSGSNCYMAMSYVEGETLADRVEREGKIDEIEALKITAKVAGALKYAWEAHMLLHRDIKPENIMIDALSLEPKLLDLGISKLMDDDDAEATITGDGCIVGTPYYMSPEQANSDKRIDFRSDMYSLGCSLFELVTGEVPYDGECAMRILSKHLLEPIPDPLIHNADLHPGIVTLLRKMMAKKANDRFKSWDDLIRSIRYITKKIESGERHVQGKTLERRKRQALPVQSSSKRGVAKILLPAMIILLLGIVIGVYIIARNGRDSQAFDVERISDTSSPALQSEMIEKGLTSSPKSGIE